MPPTDNATPAYAVAVYDDDSELQNAPVVTTQVRGILQLCLYSCKFLLQLRKELVEKVREKYLDGLTNEQIAAWVPYDTMSLCVLFDINFDYDEDGVLMPTASDDVEEKFIDAIVAEALRQNCELDLDGVPDRIYEHYQFDNDIPEWTINDLFYISKLIEQAEQTIRVIKETALVYTHNFTACFQIDIHNIAVLGELMVSKWRFHYQEAVNVAPAGAHA